MKFGVAMNALSMHFMTASRQMPQVYLKKFRSGHWPGDESFIQFCERRRDIQSYYYQAAKITDFNSLRGWPT